MANSGGSYTADKNGKNKKLVHRTQELVRDENGKAVKPAPSPAGQPKAAPSNKPEVTD